MYNDGREQQTNADDYKAELSTPEYLVEWDECIRRLRTVYGAEYMLVKDLSLDDDGKLAFVRDGDARRIWEGTPFNVFAKAYLADKSSSEALYKRIEELT